MLSFTFCDHPKTARMELTIHSDCQLSDQSSYSVGTTIEVGFSLGLNVGEIIAASGGLDVAVSITKETSEAQGAQLNCPTGPWTCALIIYPGMTRLKGSQFKYATSVHQCLDEDKSTEQPYSVPVPKKALDGTSTSRIDVCACKNFEHWADNGAPSTVCPQSCP